MSDKQQSEFDDFWKEKILDAEWNLSKAESYFVWERAWKAAIDSVVVELPSDFVSVSADVYFEGVVDALNAAGVSYK